MANTYTQLYIQIIFAVKHRQNLIYEKNRVELEKYICGIVKNNNSKPLSIYCNPDHLHLLIGLHPAISVADITRVIKANSSKLINEKKWILGKFNWQDRIRSIFILQITNRSGYKIYFESTESS